MSTREERLEARVQDMAVAHGRHAERLEVVEETQKRVADALEAVVKRMDRIEKILLVAVVCALLLTKQGQQILQNLPVLAK